MIWHCQKKTIDERDKDLRDEFIEGFFDARLQQKLYEDEANRNFCEVLQLEMLSSAVRSQSGARKRALWRDDADSDEVVRASFHSFPSQVEEEFAALQTSMSTVVNRLDKVDHTIAK